ncbi:penicillin-binding protein activator LpoB [Campylobacter sp. P255]|uniref:penicillin-binding protein activator LpoB n=1 Tax=Campylobacter sp. P255 TaxID=1979368 RepID=UPI000EA9F492|nr:penicillin-binding protein activator LpoB [Campylobacter sp. P255]RKO64329.1 penicillin-binding protein activator LpoB [Campylobacter sp. P255]
MKKSLLFTFFAIFIFSACSSQPKYTDGKASQKVQGNALTLGLDREDFENTAKAMIESMLNDPAFANLNAQNKKVLAISRIINDTPQRIDTDKLTAKITIALRKSGKFILTTAVAAGGAKDNLTHEIRNLRENDEFNQNTIASKGTILAPNFSLSGKIRQDSVKLYNGKIQSEYFFHLILTDLTSGLALWEDEKTIDKTGTSKSVTW